MSMKEVTGADIVKMLDAGIKPVVMFNSDFDYGGYAEKGMRARIVKYRVREHDMVMFTFDFDEFLAINQPLETYNFYNKDGVACLSARQYGVLTDGCEEIYADLSSAAREYQLAASTALFFEYKALNTQESYVVWLEQQVQNLRSSELGM